MIHLMDGKKISKTNFIGIKRMAGIRLFAGFTVVMLILDSSVLFRVDILLPQIIDIIDTFSCVGVICLGINIINSKCVKQQMIVSHDS